MEPNTVTDIFLSYAHEDRKIAKRLAESLTRSQGWSVWWDNSLRPGEQFAREIERVVANCRCVIVLWSAHSVSSDWVTAEVSEGWERGVLVPVLIEDCEPPLPFRQTHAADLCAWRGAASTPALLALIDDVQRVVARGSAVSPGELTARLARRRRIQRQRWLRRFAAVAGVVGVVTAAWFGLQLQGDTSNADSLAARSDAIRADLARSFRESKKTWWAFIMYSDANYDLLQTSALLAVEGFNIASTPNTRAALAGAWSMLPWMDQQLALGSNEVHSHLDFSYDGKFVAGGGGTNDTVIWDLAADSLVARIDHGSIIPTREFPSQFEFRRGKSLDFSPIERLLATGGPDDTVRLWDTNGAERTRFDHSAPVTDIQFGPHGKYLAATDAAGGMILWDVETGTVAQRILPGVSTSGPIFSSQGTYLATVGPKGTATVWRVDTGEAVASITHNSDWGKDALDGLAFSPDETILVSFAYLRSTVFHDVTTAKELWRVEESSIAGPVFSEDGSVAVLSGENLTWWDMNTRQMIFAIEGLRVGSIEVSADYSLIGTISGLSTVQIWELDSGLEIKRIPYYRWNTMLAFSPDSSRLVVSGFDEFLDKRVLEAIRLRPEKLTEKVCTGLNRNFTRTEWREYFADQPYRTTCRQLMPQE